MTKHVMIEDTVNAVKRHALKNYNKGGWDYIVECYTDTELAQIVAGIEDEAKAIAAVAEECGIEILDTRRREQEADIANGGAGL